VAAFSIGRQQFVLLSAPDDIRDLLVTRGRDVRKGIGLERARLLLGNGLLTSEGEFHLRQRRLAQPAFHRERIAGYARIMHEYAARTASTWRDGETVDLSRAVTALTLAIAGKTLFDADVTGDTVAIGAALSDGLRVFRLASLPFGDRLIRLPLPGVLRFHRARATLDTIVYRLIAEQRTRREDRGDLLSMLLLAQDTAGDGTGMTDEQLRDEVLTLLLAGHETTANGVTWALWLLAQNPEAQERLLSELHAFGTDGPGAEHVEQLPFTRAVFAEALRLYPPAWIIGRRAAVPYTVGGRTLAAGTLLLASQWVVHRDPRWWPEAERFRPERWLDTAAAGARPRFAYFPFGAGTRVCIGEQFAWMEGVLLLAALATRWRFTIATGAPVAPRPRITLRPAGPVRVVVRATTPH